MVTILRLSLCFDRICGIKKSCRLHFMKNVYIVSVIVLMCSDVIITTLLSVYRKDLDYEIRRFI